MASPGTKYLYFFLKEKSFFLFISSRKNRHFFLFQQNGTDSCSFTSKKLPILTLRIHAS